MNEFYEISKGILKFRNGKHIIEYVAGGRNIKIHSDENVTQCKNLSNLTPQQLQYCSNLCHENAMQIINILTSKTS